MPDGRGPPAVKAAPSPVSERTPGALSAGGLTRRKLSRPRGFPDRHGILQRAGRQGDGAEEPGPSLLAAWHAAPFFLTFVFRSSP